MLFSYSYHCSEAFLVAQMVKSLPAMQETWVQSLGRKILWRRAWQPTPTFMPGESYEQRSLVGYSPWGHIESDTTEWLNTHLILFYIPFTLLLGILHVASNLYFNYTFK